MKRVQDAIKWIGVLLLAAAVVQELMKPAEERRWHGRIAGFIPYDFRLPTIERILDAYWNPDDPRIFTDRVLGVGWAVNFPALFKRIRECCSSE